MRKCFVNYFSVSYICTVGMVMKNPLAYYLKLSDLGLGLSYIPDAVANADANDDPEAVKALRQLKFPLGSYLNHRDIDTGAIDLGGALLVAVNNQDMEAAEALLDAGADIHCCGDGALLSAAVSGNANLVRLLIRRGADIHAYQDMALRRAVEAGRTEAVRSLLDAGADVHAKDDRWNYGDDDEDRWKNSGDMALVAACADGHADIVKLLLDHGANVDVRNGEPLDVAAMEGHTDVVRTLIAGGADINARYEGCQPPIFTALQYGHLETVKAFFAAGADLRKIDDRSIADRSVLDSWAEEGDIDTVKLFLAAGAPAKMRNSMLAAAIDGKCPPDRRAETAKLLLVSGADVHDNEEYALLKAYARNDAKTMSVLLEAGADVRAIDNLNPSSFHHYMLVSRESRSPELLKVVDQWRERGKSPGITAASAYSLPGDEANPRASIRSPFEAAQNGTQSAQQTQPVLRPGAMVPQSPASSAGASSNKERIASEIQNRPMI